MQPHMRLRAKALSAAEVYICDHRPQSFDRAHAAPQHIEDLQVYLLAA
jgi:hypothetical protein